MTHLLDDFVDLDRYPIDDPNGKGINLVQHCRAQLDESALCCLSGFLRPAALVALQSEIRARQEHAYWIESERTPYSWRNASLLPEGHRARIRSPHRLGSVTRDQFDENGPLLGLFKCDALTEFVRCCLGFATLHRVECPYLSMNVKVMREGAIHGWHFDSNDGAVSLLVQSAGAGGRYEYVPYVRSDEDENYEQVVSIIQGASPEYVVSVDIAPGTFCLFKGYQSLHRVTAVTRGDPDRLIAVFSYDEQPGVHYNESTLRTVLGAVPGE